MPISSEGDKSSTRASFIIVPEFMPCLPFSIADIVFCVTPADFPSFTWESPNCSRLSLTICPIFLEISDIQKYTFFTLYTLSSLGILLTMSGKEIKALAKEARLRPTEICATAGISIPTLYKVYNDRVTDDESKTKVLAAIRVLRAQVRAAMAVS